jgi:transcriptional regulator with XRE-family HTH domain
MKLGDVLRKERGRKQLAAEQVAAELGLSLEEYKRLEAGESPAETWGPTLARLAIKLSAPTSRLISETGRPAPATSKNGQCGKLIRACREKQGLTQQELASRLDVPVEEIIAIENGQSPLETYAPVLLRFAHLIEQPIFNLFYPCGLPLDKLQDYP